MLDSKRFRHSVGTSDTAAQLAERYGVDREQAALAGLLHDCARNLPLEQLRSLARQLEQPPGELETKIPVLLHAPVGAALARQEFGVADPGIERAIALHTLGGERMTTLDKIIYVADKIEPGRSFPGVEDLRAMAQVDLDRALLGCFDAAIRYSLLTARPIHPTTIKARNRLLLARA